MIRREAFEPLPKGDLQDLGLSSAANNCNRLFSFPVFNFAQRDEEVSPAAKPEAEPWLTEARSPASTQSWERALPFSSVRLICSLQAAPIGCAGKTAAGN